MPLPTLLSLLALAKHYLLAALSVTAYGTASFTIGFSLASILAAHRLWRGGALGKGLPPGGTGELPAVTILKPIKGLDREMYENLASFLGQDYPRFQVIFCLQSPEDPALAVLKRLRADFPEADMEIVVSSRRVGLNPKVNNLSNAAAFIKHEMVLISDSDIRAEADCLRKLVRPLLADPRVGLVTCLYQSQRARGLGAAMEFLSVNAQFLPQAVVAAGLGGMRFAMGAVMLLPRRVLAECGGFPRLSQHLADDYCLGKAVEDLGYRIALAEPLVASIPDDWSFSGHFAHLARWSRTIRVCQPGGYFGSFVLHGFALCGINLLLNGASPPAVLALALVASARAASVAWIHLVYTRNPEILAKLPLLPLNDIIQFLAWVEGFSSRKVNWRGEEYYIQASGQLTPVARHDSPARPVVGVY